jgi:hypothetical protein
LKKKKTKWEMHVMASFGGGAHCFVPLVSSFKENDEASIFDKVAPC